MRRTATILVSLIALATLGAACGGGDDDSESSAKDAVCADASKLRSSVDTLIDDVKNLNLGSAKDQLSKVEDAATTLAGSVSDLGDDVKPALESEVSKLEDTLSELGSATSISEFTDTLSTAKSQLESALSSVRDSLSCD